ncbi:NUMOD3 domain-containing DNA-binding protein [Flavobacterium mekongense]|uniref:NUMOD3 domain-containing DNA-binding protein n=1 Tax=Flavobacterium mekongense TaxID=3379707 RepID=UPI00399A2671
MNENFIYCIKSPLTFEIRYIGQSSVGNKRFKTHLCFAKIKNRTPVQKFINKYLSLGLEPLFEVLEYCNKDELNVKEIQFINFFKSQGCDLLNMTSGGEGAKGRIVSSETRLKMSIAHKGKKMSKEHRLKTSLRCKGMNAWNKGIKMRQETIMKISSSMKGKPKLYNRVKVSCNDIVFDCVKDAANYFGCSSSSIVRYCKKQSRHKDSLIFQYI